MRVLVDCCLSDQRVPFLQQAGHDAIHRKTVGDGNAPDQALADHAETQGLVLLTQDLDFGAILATQGRTKPCVVQIRADSTLCEDVGAIVLEAPKAYGPELETGAIVTVDYGRSKIRALPLT